MSSVKAVYREKLDIKIDLSAVGINEDSIIEEQNRVLKKLIEKGINVDDFTPIEIKYHNHVNTTKKGLKTKDIVLPSPGWAGNINSDGRFPNQ